MVQLEDTVDHVHLLQVKVVALLLHGPHQRLQVLSPVLVDLVAERLVEEQAQGPSDGQHHRFYQPNHWRKGGRQDQLALPGEDGGGDDFTKDEDHADREDYGEPAWHQRVKEEGQRLVGHSIAEQQCDQEVVLVGGVEARRHASTPALPPVEVVPRDHGEDELRALLILDKLLLGLLPRLGLRVRLDLVHQPVAEDLQAELVYRRQAEGEPRGHRGHADAGESGAEERPPLMGAHGLDVQLRAEVGLHLQVYEGVVLETFTQDHSLLDLMAFHLLQSRDDRVRRCSWMDQSQERKDNTRPRGRRRS
mmetsp:Transcript_93374/g.247881  ORF Transcript_93374/g.247881 Transcript_93374/m.247881 type:complete len:306 (+) Transcript_93374:796-1713(+)